MDDHILLIIAAILTAIQAFAGLLGLKLRVHLGWLAVTLVIITLLT